VKIATWNVNSVKSRLAHLTGWLKEDAPDIVLLQETKTIDEAFPATEIEDLGYNLALHGQKTYNGVAILSKFPLDDIRKGLPGDDTDEAARYIEAVASFKGGAVRVASVYVPNGQTMDSDKFTYKTKFYDRLYQHMSALLQLNEITVVGGDYNVAPEEIDVYNPAAWEHTVLFSPEARAKLRALFHLGFYDGFRTLNPDKKQYSWWDYRAGAYEGNAGLRIDHLLLSPQAVDKLEACETVEKLRQLDKPSDHAPVICSIKH
jgi:exodeoxyribonuclease-3